MSTQDRGLAVVGAVVAVVLLCACSGTNAQMPEAPAQHTTASERHNALGSEQVFDFLAARYRALYRIRGLNRVRNHISARLTDEAKAKGLVFVADNAKNSVDVFAKGRLGEPLGSITDSVSSPDGLAVDGAANLYVANLGNNTVTVYEPPYMKSPATTYSNGISLPVWVAVGPDGTVYVSSFSGRTVVEYPKGKTKPSLSIALPGNGEGVAIDSSNNLYAAYYNENAPGSGVLEFAPGATNGTNLGIPVEFPGGLTLDRKGDLLVVDQATLTVQVYAPGATTSFQTIDNGFLDPFSIAFDAQRRHLFVSDAAVQDVQDIGYPNGTTIFTMSGFSQVLGVALSPTTSPK